MPSSIYICMYLESLSSKKMYLFDTIYIEVEYVHWFEFTKFLIKATLKFLKSPSIDIIFCHNIPVSIYREWYEYIETEEISDKEYSGIIFFIPSVECNHTSIFYLRIEYINREISIVFLISDIPSFIVFFCTSFFFCEEHIFFVILKFFDLTFKSCDSCCFLIIPINGTGWEKNKWDEEECCEFHI